PFGLFPGNWEEILGGPSVFTEDREGVGIGQRKIVRNPFRNKPAFERDVPVFLMRGSCVERREELRVELPLYWKDQCQGIRQFERGARCCNHMTEIGRTALPAVLQGSQQAEVAVTIEKREKREPRIRENGEDRARRRLRWS